MALFHLVSFQDDTMVTCSISILSHKYWSVQNVRFAGDPQKETIIHSAIFPYLEELSISQSLFRGLFENPPHLLCILWSDHRNHEICIKTNHGHYCEKIQKNLSINFAIHKEDALQLSSFQCLDYMPKHISHHQYKG